MEELFHDKSCQTYIILYRALAKAIPNAILRPAAPLAYNAIQHVITEDDIRIMLEHVFRKISLHLGGKAEDQQKHIYDLRIIYS